MKIPALFEPLPAKGSYTGNWHAHIEDKLENKLSDRRERSLPEGPLTAAISPAKPLVFDMRP